MLYSAGAAASSQEVCHALAGRIEAARFEEMVGSRALLADCLAFLKGSEKRNSLELQEEGAASIDDEPIRKSTRSRVCRVRIDQIVSEGTKGPGWQNEGGFRSGF